MGKFLGCEGKTSNYTCVSWCKAQQKWQGKFWFQGKAVWCGRHFTELEAAHAINRKCDELGIDRKQPNIGEPIQKVELDEISSSSSDIEDDNGCSSDENTSDDENGDVKFMCVWRHTQKLGRHQLMSGSGMYLLIISNFGRMDLSEF